MSLKKMLLAILTFIVLDLFVLALSFVISGKLDRDATAINLAGRQRMLSQRVTMSALLATDSSLDAPRRRAAAAEVTRAYRLFRSTLQSFAAGGAAVGADESAVVLDAVQGPPALQVANVIGILEPWPAAPVDDAGLRAFAAFMVANNDAILSAMNRLTSETEKRSQALVLRLRIIQSTAFLLSLVNFIVILRMLDQARRRAVSASQTDPLTGTANRAGLFQALEHALQSFHAEGVPMGVILVDLDNFKAVNDRLGHSSGDATLREVARLIGTCSRPGWTFGRLGGDEFAVVCAGCPEAELQQVAGEIARVLDQVRVEEPRVTGSVGHAAANAGITADALFAAADARMYQHKARRTPEEFVRLHPRQD